MEEDPELCSTKSEVWSFGLILYEMIALYPPHTAEFEAKRALDFDDTNEDISMDDEENDSIINLAGTRPLFPSDLKLSTKFDDVLNIFFLCTQCDPNERPSAKILVKFFEEMSKK